MESKNEKLIEYWNQEISIKKSNLDYHEKSVFKLMKQVDLLKKQIADKERKINYHEEMENKEKANIEICKGRIEMLKTDELNRA